MPKNGASRAEKTSSDLTAPPPPRPCPPPRPATPPPRCRRPPHRPHQRRQPRAVQEKNETGLHPRLRGNVQFSLFVRERGACLPRQEQEAVRGCRLRRRPEPVTAVERRQAAKTACSIPTHRPGVGATFLCSWAARWCPSTYFLPYSALGLGRAPRALLRGVVEALLGRC